MREFKFRAWEKHFKKMSKPFTLSDIYTDVIDGVKHVWIPFSKDSSTNIKVCQILQYTGLKDKNGKEIYEGDIVRKEFGEMRLAVVGSVIWGGYSDGEYVSNIECWLVSELPLSDLGGLYGVASHTNEVLGNIYQNPELLDPKKGGE